MGRHRDDAPDVSVLARAVRRRLGALVADLADAVRGPRVRAGASRVATEGISERRTVLVDRSRRDVYHQLKHLERLPRFLDHLSAVTVEDGRITRWTIGEGDHAITWLVQVVDDAPGERIAWESLPGSDLIADGSIAFLDGERGGTIVDLELRYQLAPGVQVDARVLDRLNGRRLAMNLRQLRELIETDSYVPRPPRVPSAAFGPAITEL
jgi:uncharacterized membrane protein